MLTRRRRRQWRRREFSLGAIGMGVAASCSKGDAAHDREQAPAVAAADDAATPVTPSSAGERSASGRALALLKWLDPDATAVMLSRLPSDLDPDAITTVFAVPPKAARLLRDAAALEPALDAVLPIDAPRPPSWLAPETLAFSSLVATGTYLVRPLQRPSAEIEPILLGAKMRADPVDGFTMLVPEGPLPYRVVLLPDDVAAFVPAREIGSGLGPLTAGRDLPAGAVERELARVLEEEPDALLELAAAGPLIHFDLGQDVIQFVVRMRAWQGGIDVQIRLHPSGDAAVAANALTNRDVSLESDQIRALCGRVAFTVDGPYVDGRLQLTADDVAVLRVRK
ncbi:MAG TPA: hypothetical protein VFG69_07130 [Nannocystaceae bacterium]|nr:hypothetical protein [Nannocystaceae bacterium]